MLWLLDIPAIELLLALWIALMIYAAIATIFLKINYLYKIIIIPVIFIVAYQSVIVSEILVGTPSYSENETQGNLGGYVIFEKNGQKQIAVLLSTKQGPMLYALPYDPDTEKNLSQAMSKLTQKGIPTLIRKKGKLSVEASQGQNGEESADGDSQGKGTNKKVGKFGNQSGPLEFYDFVDQYLIPKSTSPQ